MEQLQIPCSIYRGGTSRGIFFKEEDLPKNDIVREKIFQRAIGIEDASNINGLGGGTSHSTKVAIIEKSNNPSYDIIYTFVQVGKNKIDMNGTCGNLMSAVGLYAVIENYVNVPINEKEIEVKIWDKNINKLLLVTIAVSKGKAISIGDFSISGIQQKGTRIKVKINEPGGEKTGQTFPSGKRSEYESKNKKYEGTFSDAINPFLFLTMNELGIRGDENLQQLQDNKMLMEELELLRLDSAIKNGIFKSAEEAKIKKAIPKIAFVSEPIDYLTENQENISSKDYDIFARMLSMGNVHHSFAVSGLLNLAMNACVSGTIPYYFSKRHEGSIRIGHPQGVSIINVKTLAKDSDTVEYVQLDRTARKIMDGTIFIPIYKGEKLN